MTSCGIRTFFFKFYSCGSDRVEEVRRSGADVRGARESGGTGANRKINK